LEHCGARWQDPGITTLTDFIAWLGRGDLPSARPGRRNEPTPLDQSTVDLRLAALGSFYEFHDKTARAPHIETDRVVTGRFKPFLAHLQDRRPTRRAALVRRRRTRLGLTPVLEPGQIEAIFQACAVWSAGERRWVGNLRNRLFYETLAETGLRMGEALSLRHEDWIVGRGGTPCLMVVPRQAHPHGARVKNSKWRRIYVSDRLERLYSDYLWELSDLAAGHGLPLADDCYVFVNTKGTPLLSPITPSNVYSQVRRLKKRLGSAAPPAWTPHWFRHSHATALLLNGTPEHVVMRRLGHEHVQTTLELYGWVTEEAELRSVAEWRRFAACWRTEQDKQDVA
jgi:integrase